jgi:hypothetical protein
MWPETLLGPSGFGHGLSSNRPPARVHLRLDEDPPAPNTTRLARPRRTHRQHRHQLSHDPPLHAQHAPALVHRLKEIVNFVRGLGRDVAVVESRIHVITGADSVMIATAAETNPTVFSPDPLTDLEDTIVLPYLRLVRAATRSLLTVYSANIWIITARRPSSVSSNSRATTPPTRRCGTRSSRLRVTPTSTCS